MPHKGIGSTVSVAGVGLMPRRSGGYSGGVGRRGRGDSGRRIGSEPAGRAELEGVGSRPELPDEFPPRTSSLSWLSETRPPLKRSTRSSRNGVTIVQCERGRKKKGEKRGNLEGL
ncbi:hypothetical protein KM043_009633 [Ampulex compressa]|nr:hypothetical protein KM043_009633 [Ampulex compressa]